MQLGSLQISSLSRQALLQTFLAWSQPGQPTKTVGYLNAHVFNQCCEDPELEKILAGADLVYADGASLRLAARITGQVPPQRLTAADWLDKMLLELLQAGRRLFLLGGEEGVADEFATILSGDALRHSNIVGTHSGFWSADAEPDLVKQLNESKADLLLVGMGTPWQEKFVARNRDSLNIPCIWWVGAGMDYFTGRQQRGPAWTRALGHEWLGRLLADPERMAKRYLVGNPLFVWRVLALASRSSAS